MDFKTLITAFVTAALVPWLANKGLTITPDQTTWLTAAAVGVFTSVVHFFETKAKIVKANSAAPPPTVSQVIGAVTIKPALMALAFIAAGFVGVQDLTGCATTSGTPTFYQLISAAGQVNNTVLTTLDSLVKTKAVSSSTASGILAVTDKVQAALTLANTAYAAGDQPTAQAKLTAASAALAGVQGCLTQPATLVTCLQGVKAP